MMRAYAVNTVAPVLLMGWMLQHAAAGVPIRIVNVSTGAAVQPLPGLGAYSATKAALRLVGMIFAAEIDMRTGPPRDVSVLSYDPGVVETPMAQAVRDTSAQKLPIVQMFHQLAAHQMLRTPDVPANAIADYVDADGHPRFREDQFPFKPPPA
jgi:benzil reductase ((S)-benzoin forming)